VVDGTPQAAAGADSEPPFFHEASGTVRFWVAIDDNLVGASVSREALHHRYRAGAAASDPLQTYQTWSPEIDAAVRRRVAMGAIEPVMLREFDLRPIA